jgi:ADP-ribosylglycohydrolase
MELIESILGGPVVLAARSRAARRDRVRGMLFGVALGDALGAPHEFANQVPLARYSGRVEFPLTADRRFQGGRLVGGLGQVSDDTEMTIALANSIARAGGYDRDAAVRGYLDWANSRCPFMGRNTRALFVGVRTVDGFEARWRALRAAPVARWSQSNGCLMRAAPLAVLPEAEWRAAAALDCSLTNFHPICTAAVRAYVCAARHLLDGAAPAEATAAALFDLTSGPVRTVVESALDDAASGVVRRADALQDQRGWVLHATYCAFLALNSGNATFQDRVDRVVRLGGDTDTNAAIAGGLLGAQLGENAMRFETRTAANLTAVLSLEGAACGQLLRPRRYAAARLPALADALADLETVTVVAI